MLKLILLVAVAWVVYTLWRNARAAQGAAARGQSAAAAQPPDALHMVACRRCGVYLPEAEAVRDGDAWYCSREHAASGRAN